MKMECTYVDERRFMQGNDGTIYRNEKGRAILGDAHMLSTMDEENEWDQIANNNTVEGPIERAMREEIMVAFKENWKGAWANRGLCRNDSS